MPKAFQNVLFKGIALVMGPLSLFPIACGSETTYTFYISTESFYRKTRCRFCLFSNIVYFSNVKEPKYQNHKPQSSQPCHECCIVHYILKLQSLQKPHCITGITDMKIKIQGTDNMTCWQKIITGVAHPRDRFYILSLRCADK